jgi:hypothetical protein
LAKGVIQRPASSSLGRGISRPAQARSRGDPLLRLKNGSAQDDTFDEGIQAEPLPKLDSNRADGLVCCAQIISAVGEQSPRFAIALETVAGWVFGLDWKKRGRFLPAPAQ